MRFVPISSGGGDPILYQHLFSTKTISPGGTPLGPLRGPLSFGGNAFFLYIVIQFVLQSAFLLSQSAFVIKDYEFKPFFTKYARMYPNHKLPNIEFLQ